MTRVCIVWMALALVHGIAGCGGSYSDRDRVAERARRDLDCATHIVESSPMHGGARVVDDLEVREQRMRHWIATCGDRSRRYICRGLQCTAEQSGQVETQGWTAAGALECRASGPDVDGAAIAFAAIGTVSSHVLACGVRSVAVSVDSENGWLYVAVVPDDAPSSARSCVGAALARVHVSPPLGSALLLACHAR